MKRIVLVVAAAALLAACASEKADPIPLIPRATNTVAPASTPAEPTVEIPPTTAPVVEPTLAPPPTSAPQPIVQPTAPPPPPPPPPTGNCDPSYPDVCIAPPPPDLDCADIPYRRFRVLPPDPHRFDGGSNPNGIGCESD